MIVVLISLPRSVRGMETSQRNSGLMTVLVVSTTFQAPRMLFSELQFLDWLNRETNFLYRVIICAISYSVHSFTESLQRPYLSTDDDLHPFRNHHA